LIVLFRSLPRAIISEATGFQYDSIQSSPIGAIELVNEEAIDSGEFFGRCTGLISEVGMTSGRPGVFPIGTSIGRPERR
jgi:hypothetical protein